MIEAVLELQLANAVPMAALERTKNALTPRLPNTIEEQNYHVHLDADAGTVNVDSDPSGFRLASAGSAGEIAILKRSLVGAAKLAPYREWAQLHDLAKVTWQAFTESAQPRGDVARIGLRYVNRLDIPNSKTGQTELRDYLTFVYEAPQPPLKPSLEFIVSMETLIGDDNECGVRITSSAVDSPAPGTTGIILDIDVFTKKPVPLDSDRLWDTIARMREYKNSVFELCLTDRSRDLFSRA